MTHPIDNVYISGVPVSKSDVSSYEKVRNRVQLSDAMELRSLDLTLSPYVSIAGKRYDLDSSDTTSADDGENIIIDDAGNRFALVDGDTHGKITVSTSAPSGGDDGDIWFKAQT